MLTDIMKEHKLETGVWWEPSPSTTHAYRTRLVKNHRERQSRTVSYEVTSADGKHSHRQQSGLIGHSSSAWEPLALYIKLLYGDGVYYCRNSDGNTWLLIISDGVIVPGTDCVLSPMVFDLLMEGRKFSQYKALTLQELTDDCVAGILEHYQANQLRLKKRRYLFYMVLGVFMLILLSIPVLFTFIG